MDNNNLEYKLIENLINELSSLKRSISGEGARLTHSKLSEIIKLNTFEIKTGKKIYDWHIPQEWKVNSAKLFDSSGKVIIDIENNFLHLLNYSSPFQGEIGFYE